MEKSLKCRDSEFKEMVIYILNGWPWTTGLDTEMREAFTQSVQPLFSLTVSNKGKDITIDEKLI